MSSLVNPLDIGELGSGEFPMVTGLAKYLQENVSDNIADYYERGEFPADLPKALGGLGVLREVTLGNNPFLVGQIFREIERVDSGLRSFVSVQCSLAGHAIADYGSEEQKKQWLDSLCSGESIAAFALTEPQGGSDPSNMQTNIEQKGGKLILNGHKYWVTNGPSADVMVVWAKLGEKTRAILVPKDAPGVNVRTIKHKLSMRVSQSSEVLFTDVQLDPSALLPGANSLGKALACLNQARFGITWGVLGAMEDCLQVATEFVQNRILFKKPLASFQLTQNKLYQMSRNLAGAQLLAVQLAKLKGSENLKPFQISLGKQSNVEAALSTARAARELLGGTGILSESRVMRHACNLETVHTYEGTSDIHKLIVGLELTGENAFG